MDFCSPYQVQSLAARKERVSDWFFYLGGRSLTTLTKFYSLLLTSYLLTHGWHWRGNYCTVLGGNLHTLDISSTTYLPRLVNTVCERPLSQHCPSTSSSSSYDVLAAHPDAGLNWAVHWGWRPPAATGEAWSEPKTIWQLWPVTCDVKCSPCTAHSLHSC